MDKGTRIIGLDVARVVAILAILLCHWSRSLSWSDAGDFLGTFGNALFFLLSGLGLSVSWHAKGCPRWGGDFMLKRCLRLFPAFWIVLCIGILVHHAYVWPGVILNALGLSWFFKLPGCGYLWFVTAILIFYVAALGLTRITENLRMRRGWMISISLVGALIIQFLLAYLHIRQAWFVSFLWVSGVSFLYGAEAIRWLAMQQRAPLLAWGLFLTAFFGLGLAFGSACSDSFRCWLAVLLSLSVAIVCLKMPVGRMALVVSFIGGLTYELYLVHEYFCYTIPLRTIAPNLLLYLVAYLACALSAAYVMKRLVRMLTKKIKRGRME